MSDTTSYSRPAVIFDLDGTLIDSSPSILATFASVVADHGLTPKVPLTDALIGPPLAATMASITGIGDADRLRPLLEAFKQSYDSEGFRLTRIYPGIADVLAKLAADSHPVLLATNKRIVPTRKIVEHFGWTAYLSDIYAIDMETPAFPSKQAMLARLLENRSIEPQRGIYVGDKLEDAQAATSNGLHFIAAAWGYGDWNGDGTWHRAGTPMELLDIIVGWDR